MYLSQSDGDTLSGSGTKVQRIGTHFGTLHVWRGKIDVAMVAAGPWGAADSGRLLVHLCVLSAGIIRE